MRRREAWTSLPWTRHYASHSAQQKAQLHELPTIIQDLHPHVIAIDSPPAWSLSGRSRPVERQLERLGINAFPTPSVDHVLELRAWMQIGFPVFTTVASLAYPLHRGEDGRGKQAIEVFPHASAVVLRGGLPARRTPKHIWRPARAASSWSTVNKPETSTPLFASASHDYSLVLHPWRGLHRWDARPRSFGVACCPTPHPPLRAGQCVRTLAEWTERTPARQPPERQCGCGCGVKVRRRYLPGHDAKHRARLMRELRNGSEEAARVLAWLGWMSFHRKL